nr:hypothetical protein [Tanacetum cinerariifolium]
MTKMSNGFGERSDENKVDLLKRCRSAFKNESKGKAFTQDGTHGILREHSKWEPAEPVDVTEHTEKLRDDLRPHPTCKKHAQKTKFGDHVGDKDRTIISLEEMKFLETSTAGMTVGDAYIINKKKDSGRGSGTKKKSNMIGMSGSNVDSGFPSLNQVNVVSCDTRNATSALGNGSNPMEVGHESAMKETPTSYATKLSPMSLTKTNLCKLDANVLNDVLDTLKKTICVEYEWEPPQGSAIGGTKNFKPVSMKPKPQYRLKVNQAIVEASPKKASSVGKLKALTAGKSSMQTDMKNAMTSGNGIFSLSNSFEALNVDDPVTVEVESANEAFTSGVQEEGNSSTPLVEKIHRFEQLLDGKCVLVDEDGKLMEKVDCLGDQDSEDEVEPDDNEMASFLASKTSGVGYGTKSLLEQWRRTYGNVDQEYDYDPYDDDMYECEDIPNNIHNICNNLDIKVRGRSKK